jgi:hypothetical protein
MKRYYFVFPKNITSFKYFKDVWFNPIFKLSGKCLLNDEDYTIMTTTSIIKKFIRLEVVYSPTKSSNKWFIIGLI